MNPVDADSRLVFFLGGYDLEMVAIRDLLTAERVPFHDKRLAWGAKTSAYRDEIGRALADHHIPVLVELTPDLDLPAERVHIVDHHGERAGERQPTSLEQVFRLLKLPRERWSRWFDLVAANDRGHIAGMLALHPPADTAEILRVRKADREAQGVVPDEERAAELAVAKARVLADGKLTVVELPHERTSPVADRMEAALGGPGFVNLLILAPQTVSIFGEGRLIQRLVHLYPGGWYGGALPVRGFWGRPRGDCEDWGARVQAEITALSSSTANQPKARG